MALEPPPEGFQSATDAEYTASLIKAVDAMGPTLGVSLDKGGIVTPVMQTSIVSLRTALEAASGLPFGNLVSLAGDIGSLAGATNAAEVVSAIGSLVETGVSLATDIGEVIGDVSGAMGIVPIVGQIVGTLFDAASFIASVWDTSDEDKEYLGACMEAVNKQCGDWAQATGPVGIIPTGIYGDKTPADNFRQLAYAYKQGKKNEWGKTKDQSKYLKAYHYPANTSTVILMLCGGAAEGFGLTEQRYQAIVKCGRINRLSDKGFCKDVSGEKVNMGNRAPGLPWETRVRLWKCIQAIMACVQVPESGTKVIGDQGRSVAPILMDILRTGQEKGLINQTLYRDLAEEAFEYTDKWCFDGEWEPRWHRGCGKLVRQGLSDALYNQIMTFEASLKDPRLGFWNNQTSRWIDKPKASPSASQAAGLPAAGARPVLKMRPQQVNQASALLSDVAKQAGSLKRDSASGSIGFVIGATVLGAYLLLKGRR